jgi:hypothetical protein
MMGRAFELPAFNDVSGEEATDGEARQIATDRRECPVCVQM